MCLLRTSPFAEAHDLERMFEVCAAGRCPPVPPSSFRKFMRTGVSNGSIAFTVADDFESIILPCYEKSFASSLACSGSICFCRLAWSDADIEQLCHAFDSLGELPNCKILNLASNSFGDPGMHALAQTCSRGSLANLEELNLTGNKFTAKGESAIEAILAEGKLPKLQVVIGLKKEATKLAAMPDLVFL